VISANDPFAVASTPTNFLAAAEKSGSEPPKGIRKHEMTPNLRFIRTLTVLANLTFAWSSAAAFDKTTPSKPVRVAQDQIALYTFAVIEDGLVKDRSEFGEPLNLRIDKPQNALVRDAKTFVSSSVVMASDGPATKVIQAWRKTNALTIEVWMKPLDLKQSGPARIVSLSGDTSQRNLTLGQDKGRLDVRLRTSATDNNGQPSTAGPENSMSTKLTHVVFTRTSSSEVGLYQDGKKIVSSNVAGDFTNWSDEFRLSIANEITGDRPWLGDLHLVALYNRALSDAEVLQNFSAGVPMGTDFARLLPPAHEGQVDFVRDIQPIFRQHCYDCHSADHEDGGVNLGIRDRALQGGHDGPVFEVGNSANSRLIHLVAAIDSKSIMPPETGGLNKIEIGLLRAWIDQGAAWPDGTDVADPREEKAKSHWAFKRLLEVAVPAVKDATGPQTPIDNFILAKLEEAKLASQQPAAARELIRRIHFDLIGLPPTPEEVDAFCIAAKKDRKSAINELVDRLLASPHYGERWGRHWLDVARYADSDGQESDRDRPTAYHYRDFVIRSLNKDMPYDQFIRWQLAGDEYEPANPEAVAATGFLAAGPFAALPDRLMEDERLRNRYNELDDMLSTIGTGFLGLTLGCVRCHDHKYDAIPARDYYSLMSAFHGGERAEVPLGNMNEKVLAYRDLGPDPGPTWLFQRGNFYDRDQPVSLGFVSVLTSGKSPSDYLLTARELSPSKQTTNQRRAMAEWMTDTEHGAGALLARVIVNRIWQQHFGHGIVRTPGDFGVRSEAPSHPELLEWLTHDFVQHGWQIKHLHRLIVQSAVYQQSSHVADLNAATATHPDSDNRLLWKFPMQRIEGEILRDAMLAVSGTLNTNSYGPAVKPPIAGEAIVARNLKDGYPDKIEDSPEIRRRSIYLFHKRVVPYPLLQAFDKPDAQQTCSRRDHTTVAPQALALLNDPFVRTVSSEFADRLMRQHPDDLKSQLRLAYRLALSRDPEDDELSAADEFVVGQSNARKALTDFCQTIFALNEFLYVD
jgi:mono/diheme cytochrome c family protein